MWACPRPCCALALLPFQVIVCGDFNIDATQADVGVKEYKGMLETLQSTCGLSEPFVDLLLAHHGDGTEHPNTTVPYFWHRETGEEVVLQSYLTPWKGDPLVPAGDAAAPSDGGGENEKRKHSKIMRKALRLDYLLWSGRSTAPMRPERVELLPFAVEDRAFTHLSDHMGIHVHFTCEWGGKDDLALADEEAEV